MSDKPIYEKLESETQKAYEAFCTYRDMGSSRSTARVMQEHGKSKAVIQGWCNDHNWVKRVEAYDLEQEAIARQILEEENREAYRQKLRKYRQENEDIGNAFRATGVAMLKEVREFAKNLKASDIKVNNIANVVRSIETCMTMGDRFLSESLGVEKLLQQMKEDEKE